MNVLSHALLPALLAAPLMPRGTPREFYASAGLVALAGALPDILHPHLSLAARYTSWSHSVFALGGWTLVFVGAALLGRGRTWRRAAWLAPLAYAMHLFLDGISGGIAWLYPISSDVLSHRLVRYPYWFPIDAALALVACAVALWLRRRYWSGDSAAEPIQRAPIDDPN